MARVVLGVDIASARWVDNGTALIEFTPDTFVGVETRVLTWPHGEPLTARRLAGLIDALARDRGVTAVSLDGPQGWRHPETPEGAKGVGRRAEYACRTQGKTGTYPTTYPGTQRRWFEFSIAVFDALLDTPGVTLATAAQGAPRDEGYQLLESFPTSTWRHSGLTPLPGKSKRPDISPFVAALTHAHALPKFTVASHDDLQAVVAALPAVAVSGGPARALRHGVAAADVVHADGVRRRVEGYIWDAAPTILAT